MSAHGLYLLFLPFLLLLCVCVCVCVCVCGGGVGSGTSISWVASLALAPANCPILGELFFLFAISLLISEVGVTPHISRGYCGVEWDDHVEHSPGAWSKADVSRCVSLSLPLAPWWDSLWLGWGLPLQNLPWLSPPLPTTLSQVFFLFKFVYIFILSFIT